jgi:hypothetical protein
VVSNLLTEYSRAIDFDALVTRSMSDVDGPRVAQWFYEALFKKETIELDDIPFALDDAVQRLRGEGASPQRWATFVHMGA